MILTLAGGVGGARMCAGLAQALPADGLTIVVNTGDDFEHLGLSISPDIDSVLYTLSGRHDPQRGWGQAGETWRCMEMLEVLGGQTWFRLGDGDLAMHLWRTQMLREGLTLSEVTARLSRALGVRHSVVPMADIPVRTRVLTEAGELAFQDYFVRQQCKPRFVGIRWGEKAAPASAGLYEALETSALAGIVICPSNPFLSIQPILGLRGVEDALRNRRTPVVAVSPIVGGQSVKGPLGKMLGELGRQASSAEVASLYRGLIDGIVIDKADAQQVTAIEKLGICVHVTDTLMPDSAKQYAVAREALEFTHRLGVNKRP